MKKFILITMSCLQCIIGFAGSLPMFGKDVPIYNRPDKSELDVSICCAYNGWLFSAVTYDSLSLQRVRIQKSIDGGINWATFADHSASFTHEIIKVDIASTGNNQADLKIVLAMVYYDTITHSSYGMVRTFNGLSGEIEQLLINSDEVNSVDLFSDPLSQFPNRLLCLYSQTILLQGDSLFLNCYEGGQSFSLTSSKTLYSVGTLWGDNPIISEVTVGWGKSQNMEDHYYAAWITKDDWWNEEGHLFTTGVSLQGNMLPIVCLDSLNPELINHCSNPSIACLYDDIDNSAGDITSVISFRVSNYQGKESEIIGFYNLQAATGVNFTEFTPNITASNRKDASICYSHLNHDFFMTYADYTLSQLPLLRQDINFTSNTWEMITSGYNDSINTNNCGPEVIMNYTKQGPVFAWISDRGKKMAFCDAQYSIYNKIEEKEKPDIIAFPNPCMDKLTLNITPGKSSDVTIQIFNIEGMRVRDPFIVRPGESQIILNLFDLKSGYYLISLLSENSSYTIPFVKK